jgi:hypothetical protein
MIVALFGSGSCSGYLKSDGTCSTPGGTWASITNGAQTGSGTSQLNTLPGNISPRAVGTGAAAVATGVNWTANGYDAGRANTTGVGWTATGSAAGYYSTTGSNWTATGVQTGYYSTTGSNWTATGSTAGYNNQTGSGWTATGMQAGFFNQTGSNWTANGFDAGMYIADGATPNESGNNSVYEGANAYPLADGDTNETVIGYAAIGHGSNTVTLGNSTTTGTYYFGSLNNANGPVIPQTALGFQGPAAGYVQNAPSATGTPGCLYDNGSGTRSWVGCSGGSGTGFNGGAGTSFQDALEIAAPANPASTYDRLYLDSTAHQLKCLTSSGGSCMPSGSGTVTTSGSPVSPNIAAFSSSTAITAATSANIQTAIGASVYDAYGAAAARQANLSLLAGTYVNGDMCTYTASGTLLNCNTAPYSLPGTVVQTNQANTYTTGLQDFIAATMRLPSSVTVGENYINFPASSGTLALTSQLPSVGTWGALNYPIWVSGIPFVKMTAAGTFSLDTNTYLTTATAASTYAPIFTLTTTGSSGAATYSGNVLNIPQYAGGGSMTWPSAAGIAVYGGSSAWGTSLTAPAGTIVGTTDTQTLINKTLDGVTPTTMGYVDPTSSIQTQLNGKQAAFTSQTANYFFAAPNGSSGTPLFRAIVAADIPTLNQNTTGTASNLSGTPALPNGTTATTQTAGDNSTKLATTTYVATAVTNGAYTLPAATSSTLGGVKPDGTTIANSSGAISCTTATTSQVGCAKLGATGGSDVYGAAAGVTPATLGVPVLIAAGTVTLATGSIASGAQALPSTTTVTTTYGTAANILYTDLLGWNFQNSSGTIFGTLGYEPATTGMLTVACLPSSSTPYVNCSVANNTSAAITPGAITITWYDQRHP